MKTPSRLLYVAAAFVVLAACASPAASPAPTVGSPANPTALPAATVAPQSSAAPADLLLARPDGEWGPLVAYDLATGSVRFELPAGIRSANGEKYLSASLAGADTQLSAYDLATGATAGAVHLAGQWDLSALSPTGRWAALTQIIPDSQKQQWTTASDWQTQFQIIDTEGRLTPQSIILAGNFAVDALSSRGDSLYLIEYLPAHTPKHYQVRLYDLSTHTLVDGALVDKRNPDEVMWGERREGLGSPDGRWQLTLYVRADDGEAFIHALDLDSRFTFCLDLPGKSVGLDSLKNYSLAIAPSGQVIYAANPALGIVARVDLADLAIATATQFEPIAAPVSAEAASRSIISPDGRTLFFTDGFRAWSFATQSRAAGNVSLLADAPGITGLGVSPDGKRLYLASEDQSLVVLDSVTGEQLNFQAASAASQ